MPFFAGPLWAAGCISVVGALPYALIECHILTPPPLKNALRQCHCQLYSTDINRQLNLRQVVERPPLADGERKTPDGGLRALSQELRKGNLRLGKKLRPWWPWKWRFTYGVCIRPDETGRTVPRQGILNICGQKRSRGLPCISQELKLIKENLLPRSLARPDRYQTTIGGMPYCLGTGAYRFPKKIYRRRQGIMGCIHLRESGK